MAKRHAGVINRPIPDWYIREMYGGRQQQNGVGGKVTYIEVYNSSKAGQQLYIWTFQGASGAIDEIIPEWYHGTFATSFGGQAPLLSGGPNGIGIIGGFNNATCVGTEIGDFLTTANNGVLWSLPWPLAVILPGYSFAFHTAGLGAYLDMGVWWQETPEY